MKDNFKKIFYGNGEEQFGELRLPEKGDGPFPIIVIIHGGFWKKAYDLKHIRPLANAFTSHGFVTWNIEYRRVGHVGGGWPGTFADVSAALQYVDKLANLYPIDLERVVTLGHSAGGHLALWVAAQENLHENSPIRFEKNPLPVKGVLSLAGIGHLETMYQIHHWEEKLFDSDVNPTRDLLGGTPAQYKERYEHGSPSTLLPISSNIVLIHGELDIAVPFAMSKMFDERARASGTKVELIPFRDLEHYAIIQPDTKSWPVLLEKVQEIIRE